MPGTGVPRLLNNGLVYLPDASFDASGASGFQAGEDILEKGWQYEFAEHNLEKALQYYKQKAAHAAGAQSAGEIYNAMARVQ